MKISDDLIKNDVPATGQLRGDDCVGFHIVENADIKITFLGNSITRHGRAENIGWFGDWGMAASCEANDYVHKLVGFFEEGGKTVSRCVANLSEWERSRDMSLLKTKYAAARDFNADIVIVRLGENARLGEFFEEFKPCYTEMVEYFAANGAKVVLTDLFWEYEPFDNFVKRFAKKRGFCFVKLHDLGADDKMKALGMFGHGGVAVHPGDRGMEEIAKRLYAAISN